MHTLNECAIITHQQYFNWVNVMGFETLWGWLKDLENLSVLQFILPTLFTVLGGVWILYKHFLPKKSTSETHIHNNQSIVTDKINNSTINITQKNND